ncbi:MAG: MerR family transcriptional regulator [Erythrobacter sp.]
MATFEDGKDTGALRTIGEVSEALGIKQHVLRYWEQQFDRLDPLKRSGGRRYYRPADIALIERIDRLINVEGYTIKGAASVLRSDRSGQRAEPPATAKSSVEQVVTPAVANAVVRLKAIRARLADARDT